MVILDSMIILLLSWSLFRSVSSSLVIKLRVFLIVIIMLCLKLWLSFFFDLGSILFFYILSVKSQGSIRLFLKWRFVFHSFKLLWSKKWEPRSKVKFRAFFFFFIITIAWGHLSFTRFSFFDFHFSNIDLDLII